jgi:hypothetical protein
VLEYRPKLILFPTETRSTEIKLLTSRGSPLYRLEMQDKRKQDTGNCAGQNIQSHPKPFYLAQFLYPSTRSFLPLKSYTQPVLSFSDSSCRIGVGKVVTAFYSPNLLFPLASLLKVVVI